MNVMKASTKQCDPRAEEIILVAAISDSNFDGKGKRGKTIRQERPVCCGKVIDLFQAHVTFRDVPINGMSFTVLEPCCSCCLRKVQADYQILS